jgi:hypothetical protein
MTDITIPAPAAATPEPSTETTTTTPQPEKAAGPEQQNDPAPSQDGEPEKELTQGELNKRERNRVRWRNMKESAAASQRRAEVAEAELERLRSAKEPDWSQYTDPNEELAERTAHKVRQGFVQSVAEDHKARAAAEHAQAEVARQEAWRSTVDDMRSRIPDYDQVVTPQTPIHARAAPFIVDSERGGEIAYWLGKNPQAAADLFDKFESSPAQALMELGRIEARLSTLKAKTASTAPKPAPVLSGGQNPLGFDPQKGSVDDMAAQLRKAGIIR